MNSAGLVVGDYVELKQQRLCLLSIHKPSQDDVSFVSLLCGQGSAVCGSWRIIGPIVSLFPFYGWLKGVKLAILSLCQSKIQPHLLHISHDYVLFPVGVS